MSAIDIAWTKCGDGTAWCSFTAVDLSNVDTYGVYLIWIDNGAGNPVVRVGQGDIASRIRAHRLDPEIMQYASQGVMRVTWAAVSPFFVDGVERHLATRYTPLVGDCFPDCDPVVVNDAA